MKKILSIILVALLICTVMLPVTANAATIISTVKVKINKPFAGDNPDFAGSVTGAGYEIDSITYRDINKTDNKWLEKGDGKRFEKGHSYEVIIVLDSKSGYEFATSSYMPAVTGTINGYTATVSREDGTIAQARIELKYTFNSVNELVNKVKVNIAKPFAGNTPDFTGTVTGTGFEIENITYRDINKTDGKWLEKGDGKKFEKGHSYEAIIVLDSKSGYEFATNANGTPNVSGTINGFTATVSKEDGTIAAARIELRYTFNSVNELVNSVKVNIAEPVAGNTPDFTGTVTGTGFEIENITYRDINKTDGKWLEKGDGKKFEKGHSYEAIIVLDSKSGYEFATNANGTPNVSGTINGFTATVSRQDGTIAAARIELKYTFKAYGEPASYELSATSYTYDGKVKTPTVTVKDTAGKTLVEDTDYTVSYASGRKNAGTYNVTVTMKGGYKGSKTLSFKINPVNVSKCKITLSKTSYTYNGKAQKPTVTVKNANGTKLTTSSYTVTYASGRKNVGKYKVTIKMKGNYTGTKTLYFKINPVKTSIKSLTAGSKKLTVNITKKSTQVTGYQIQYSTSKKFTSAKTKTVSSYKTTKATLSGLKAKKTYYVKVRTYKTVNGTKYYSGWSTVKYKKTK